MQANYTPERVTYRALPLFILVAAVALFGIGWAVENEINVKAIAIESIFKPTTPSAVQPTAQVVVVANNNQGSVAPKVIPAPPVIIPAAPAVPASQPVQLPAYVTGQAPVVAAAPVITVTATLQPTLPPVTATPAIERTQPSLVTTSEENVSGHCNEWTNEGCVVYPTATTAPVYQPPVVAEATATPLPPTPTITPTPLPENNSISSIVTLQGSKNHGNTTIIVTSHSGVVAHMATNEGGLFQGMGLDKGTYQLAAYSANGSHLPACTTVTVGGNESIAIPQTMLRSINLAGSTSGAPADETINIGAAALVAIQFGLSIPEHLVPILDVNRDNIVNETDANMLIANPRLLACQAW